MATEFTTTTSMMDFISQPVILFFAVALLHLFSVLYFAVVRWFHVCAPYKEHPDDFFPARKCLSLMCLFALVEIPYILNPYSHVCFLTACTVLAWNYPLAAVLACVAYFKVKGQRVSQKVLVRVILCMEIVFAFAVMLAPAICQHHSLYIMVVIATISFMLYIVLAVACHILFKMIRSECLDNYSDISQFPNKMGYIALFSMLIVFVLTSLPLVTQSRWVLAWVQGVLIVWHVVFLVRILDSQLSVNGEGMEKRGEIKLLDGVDADMDEPSVAPNEVLCQRIVELMVDKKPYLDSHFTAVDLAAELGTNRTYLTNAIKTKYDNFYHLINSYRLDYANEYLKTHPDTKKEQLATISGFGSYRSYIRALKSYS